ncbi:MAG TPA: hypothetical protein ENJ87_11830 [Gammaproteobacteria bacterium]|nr:hypothetical protein [Gammaproteobacteria bacterium]
MRFFVLMALFMIPMIMVQFFSSDPVALADTSARHETPLNNRPDASVIAYADKNFISNKRTEARASGTLTKDNAATPPKTKKIRLVRGKKNSQQMHLLSVFLFLKDKSK